MYTVSDFIIKQYYKIDYSRCLIQIYNSAIPIDSLAEYCYEVKFPGVVLYYETHFFIFDQQIFVQKIFFYRQNTKQMKITSRYKIPTFKRYFFIKIFIIY